MLIPSRAFVVQIDSAASLDDGSFAGRVDHIDSGEMTHFGAIDDLVAFMKSVIEGHGRKDDNADPHGPRLDRGRQSNPSEKESRS